MFCAILSLSFPCLRCTTYSGYLTIWIRPSWELVFGTLWSDRRRVNTVGVANPIFLHPFCVPYSCPPQTATRVMDAEMVYLLFDRIARMEFLLAHIYFTQLHGNDTLSAATKPECHSTNTHILSSSQKRRLRSKRAKLRRSTANVFQEDHVHIPVVQQHEHTTQDVGMELPEEVGAASSSSVPVANVANATSTTQSSLAGMVADVPSAASSSLVSVINVANVTSTQPMVVDAPLAASSSHASVDNVVHTTSTDSSEHVHIAGDQQQQHTGDGKPCRVMGSAGANMVTNIFMGASRRARFPLRRRRREMTNAENLRLGTRDACITCATTLMGKCFCEQNEWPECVECANLEHSLLAMECQPSSSDSESEPSLLAIEGQSNFSDPEQCCICGLAYLEHDLSLLHVGSNPICESCYGEELSDEFCM